MKKSIFLLFILFLVCLSAWFGLTLGAIPMGWKEVISILWTNASGASSPSDLDAIVWHIRTPRVLLGLVIGALLGLCGAAMQGLFRNPLADPGLTGISAGAALFAVLWIVFGPSTTFSTHPFMLSWAAFVGAATCSWLVYQLAGKKRHTSPASLLLAGIAINALSGALTGLCLFVASDAQLRSIQFWTLGSLGGASWEITRVALFAFVPVILILPRWAKHLNAFALGQATAGHLGLPVQRLTAGILLLTTLGVGVSVALCGAIGFVGLVIPHVVRFFIGADHRWVLPASALLGAFLLTSADILARTVVVPAELPIGIVTAILGTPLFFGQLIRFQKSQTI
ncbi:MAG: FecCD family ABC transporter permease [Spirosomataceae bacterium]